MKKEGLHGWYLVVALIAGAAEIVGVVWSLLCGFWLGLAFFVVAGIAIALMIEMMYE